MRFCLGEGGGSGLDRVIGELFHSSGWGLVEM